MGLLPADQIQQLLKAAIATGLVSQQDTLLSGLPNSFTATLSAAESPSARLLQTLHTLNGIPTLVDGTVPLATWLRAAVALTESRIEQRLFHDALDALNPGRSTVSSGLPTRFADIVKRDDSLWLKHLREAGLSLDAGVSYVLDVNGDRVAFVPMKPQPDGTPTPGLKAAGPTANRWHDIPKGTTLRIRVISSEEHGIVTTGRVGSGEQIIIGGNATGNLIVQGSNQTVNMGGISLTPGSGAQSSPIKILFLGAAPTDEVRQWLGKEVREIDRNLRESDAGRRFELVQEWAVRPTDLSKILLRHRPTIVHFSGHGTSAGELKFEDETGNARTVPVTALGRLFSILGGGVRCVVLNACYSQAQAEALREHVDCVIGMKETIEDAAAIAFASSFYLGLGHGESARTSFELGVVQIEMTGVAGADVPVLLSRTGADPNRLAFAPGTQARR